MTNAEKSTETNTVNSAAQSADPVMAPNTTLDSDNPQGSDTSTNPANPSATQPIEQIDAGSDSSAQAQVEETQSNEQQSATPQTDNEQAQSGTKPQKSLGQRAVKGAAWMLIAQVFVNILRLAQNLVAAKFLDPDAWGVMAIVITIMIGLAMISDVGIEQSVIYDPDGEDEDFLHTAFTLQVARGIILWILAYAISYPFAYFYDKPILISLIPLVCLQLIFAGFNSMKFPWNKRRVTQVRELAFIEMLTQFTTFTVTVILAWYLRSVWALAIGAAVYGFTKMLLTYLLISGPKDGFGWHKTSITKIVNYGQWILVSTLVTFIGLRFDIFALGKLTTDTQLGLYNLALMLTSALQIIGFHISQNILFPALSEAARGTKENLQRTFEQSQKVVLPFGLWGVTGFAYLGPAFFYYIYRAEFAEAGTYLQAQLLFTWFTFVMDNWVRALMAVNDNRSMAVANVVRMVFAPIWGLSGYLVGGIYGFILGLGLASLTAHAYVHIALIKHGITAYKLDVIYTFFGSLLILFGVYAPYLLSYNIGWPTLFITFVQPMPISIVLSLMVGLPFTGILLLYVRQNVKLMRQQASAATA